MAWVVGDPLLCDPQHNSHAGVEEDARDQVYQPIPQLGHPGWLLLSAVLLTARSMFHIKNTATYIALCSLEFWLSIDGIYIIFITLVLRLLRIFHVFRIHLHTTGKFWSDKYLLLYVTLLFTPMLLLSIVKATVDPFYFDDSSKVLVSTATPPFMHLHGQCSCSFLNVWVISSSTLISPAMVIVMFLAVQTRHINQGHQKGQYVHLQHVHNICHLHSTLPHPTYSGCRHWGVHIQVHYQLGRSNSVPDASLPSQDSSSHLEQNKSSS